jgi:hypothetical protein
VIWAWLPLVGPIRWTTLLAFVACVVVGWYRFGALRGILAAMAGISTFELIFNATGTAIHNWPLAPLLWQGAALTAWPLLAWREKIRPSFDLVVLFGVLWIAWIAQGFTFNVATHDLRYANVLAELLNATTKTIMIVAWSLPPLALGRSLRHWRRKGQLVVPAYPDRPSLWS